jgi:hypothetical protein
MSDASWPGGWEGWSVSERRIVVAYRPDVFDGGAFPAPCLPTLYATKGKRRRQPGDRTRPDDPWFVTLYLEPEVSRDADRYESREAAVEGARELAAQFDAGEVDYRDRYQVPREAYLDRLDELTGTDRPG